jgi:hypothetical protein
MLAAVVGSLVIAPVGGVRLVRVRVRVGVRVRGWGWG